MDTGDATAQGEEIIVLQSVFVDEFVEHDGGSFTIKVASSNINLSPITLDFTYPASYPSKDPPVFTLHSAWLDDHGISLLSTHLRDMFVLGEVVVYSWVDWLRENAVSFLGIEDRMKNTMNPAMVDLRTSNETDTLELVEDNEVEAPSSPSSEHHAPDPSVPIIHHGVPVTDRKSKFQAHMAVVHSVAEAERVIAELLKDKRIANATHNISAYRIIANNGVQHADRDDDGETGAGDKLLYLLDKSNYTNIIVVVTRWFGGTMLGADRFKHITAVAQVLLDQKYKYISEEVVNGFKGGKFRPAEDVYNRIKWDTEIDKDDFIIGYEDRFVGDMEIPFTEFGATDVPFHRIRYYKKHTEVLWDRRKKIDNFFL